MACACLKTNAPRSFSQLAQPDVYVKGGDYTLETLDADERRAVESAGGRICLMSLVPGRSTTTLVEKMVSTQGTEEAAKLHLMGVVALQQGDWSQAHTLLQQALVKAPSLGGCLVRFGHCAI